MPQLYYSAKLSPADQVAPISHTSVFASFQSDDPKKAADRMEWALHEMCRQLPWLAGIMSRQGEQGFSHLIWKEGSLVTLERLDGSSLPPFNELAANGMRLHELKHDFRPTGVTTREVVEGGDDIITPAMLATCTILKGGLVICITTHHHLCDGGQATIFNIWADIAAGRSPRQARDPLDPLRRYDLVCNKVGLKEFTSSKGSMHGQLTEDQVPEKIRDMLRQADGINLTAKTPANTPSAEQGKVPLANEVFSFPVSTLDATRNAIKKAIGVRPSSVIVVIALFWSMMNDVREQRQTTLLPQTDDGEEPEKPKTTIVMPITLRPVFDTNGELHESNYVGNLISPCIASSEVSTFHSALPPQANRLPATLLAAVKLLMSSAQIALDPERIRALLQVVMSIPDARMLLKQSTLSANDMLATAWSHLEMYPDFGKHLGRPLFIRPGANKVAKTTRACWSYVVMLAPRPAVNGDKVLDVFTCFEQGDMDALKMHPVIVGMTEGASTELERAGARL